MTTKQRTIGRIRSLIDASRTPAIRIKRNLTAEEMDNLVTYEYLSRMTVWQPSGRIIRLVNRLWSDVLGVGNANE